SGSILDRNGGSVCLRNQHSIEFATRVAHSAHEALGDMFIEGDEVAFRRHIQGLLAQGDVPVQKRIATLFAFWSNIDSLGDQFQVGPEHMALGINLRDRKFSILNELMALCPWVIHRVIGVKPEIKGSGEIEMFKAILGFVDQQCREQRLNDRDSVELLFKMLGAWAQKEQAGQVSRSS
ncbi:MAG TPA: hypothetical protein PKX82_02335, partial [Rhodoferax sp.]|nr:hypothetical protein [Rhodoferax sp.]